MPWPIRTASKEYPSVHYIHPYKQGVIEELIEYTRKNYPNIYRIGVFGSTVDGRCKAWSDVDIIIWGDTDMKFIPPNNDVYDCIRAEELNTESYLYRQIVEEGCVVYDTRLDASG